MITLIIPAVAYAGFSRVPEFGSDESTNVIAWGDYNNDGYPDIVLGIASPDYTNRLFSNDGAGSFNPVTPDPFGGRETYALAWGDVEGNGDLDLALGNHICDNFLYVNLGGPLYDFNGMGLFFSSSYSYSMSWADYDLDGDVDIAVGSGSDNENIYYENIGGLGFTPIGDFGFGYTYGLNWGDFDGDSDADMAVINGENFGNDGQNFYYENVGGGTFTVFTAFGTAVDDNRSGAVGDYDNDGDLDIAISGYGGTLSKLYTNDGHAIFTSSEPFETNAGINNTSVAWGDYDNDGDLDLAMGSSDSYATRLYTNNGGGFTELELPSSYIYTNSIAWADFDKDGDLDLAVSDIYSQSYLYVNDQNDTFDDEYLSVHVVGDGATTNIQGIGARVEIYQPGHAGESNYLLNFCEVNANNSGGQNYVDPFFGIPGYSQVDVVVGWPSSGKFYVSEYWANIGVGGEFEAIQGEGTPLGIEDGDTPNNPVGFYLSPPVPNPSSGATTIGFALPHACNVELVLFDIKGRKIATLAEGEHQPGEYSVTANGLSNGLYLYRLTADEYSGVKKMVVR